MYIYIYIYMYLFIYLYRHSRQHGPAPPPPRKFTGGVGVRAKSMSAVDALEPWMAQFAPS